ncbi:MAG TPA: hypothetical protein VEK76_10470 [Candidatus Binatia bacterium]|nr:hypothetical protein [Candidatus Binatia bacterium]
MSDATPPEPDLDTVAASLHLDAADVAVFFQVFAGKLLATVPGMVEVQREGGMFKKEHPIRKITVRAAEDVFEAELRRGTVVCRHAHAVRGIVLRSEELGFDAWRRALVQVLGSQAQLSAEAVQALRSEVT